MNPKTIRNTAFHLHRWLGLIEGILLCIAGLTGSVLVFWHEIDHAVVAQRFGQIIPIGERVPIAAIADRVKAAYLSKGLTLSSISLPEHVNQPYLVWFHAPADHHWQVFVNPYTGQVMGNREWESSWVGIIYGLHYKLLAGDTDLLIMGIVMLSNNVTQHHGNSLVARLAQIDRWVQERWTQTVAGGSDSESVWSGAFWHVWGTDDANPLCVCGSRPHDSKGDGCGDVVASPPGETGRSTRG